jgi:pimeloyl-ACP methyl ester carboxylesterase
MSRFIAAAVIAAAIALPSPPPSSHSRPPSRPGPCRPRALPCTSWSAASGPAVVLLHGFGDTGAMWSPLASRLAAKHTGWSCRTCAAWDCLRIPTAATTNGPRPATSAPSCASSASTTPWWSATTSARWWRSPTPRAIRTRPIAWWSWTRRCRAFHPWEQIVRNPLLWHFSFGGPDAERLVAGRERIYLDRFWNEFAGNPAKIDEATRTYYAKLYARPGAMHSAFAQFLSFPKDVEDNRKAIATKLGMPVLAIGGARSFGANEAVVMRNAATNVTEVVIPDAGHWLMEEAPGPTMAAIQDFIDGK